MTQLMSLGRKEDTSRRIDAKAQEIRTLHLAIERFPDSVTEQQQFWCRVTGKSRASFFGSLLGTARSDTDGLPLRSRQFFNGRIDMTTKCERRGQVEIGDY